MAIALLGLYAACILYTARHTGAGATAASFFVNNRASGAAGVAFSIIVSCVGASATVGMIGMAFAVGTPAFWWLGAGACGLTLLSLLLARRVRASGAITLPEMAERYLGPAVRPLIAVVVVVAWPGIVAAQFAALSQVLHSLTGFPHAVVLGLGFILVVLHTLGGQAAVMRADRVQALVILAALAVMLFWLTGRNPSWPSLTAFQAVNESFPPSRLWYFLVVVGANYLVCPMLFGRLFSAKSATAARAGGLMAVAGIVLVAALIVCVGLACRGLVPEGTPQDAVLGAALATVFPEWLMIIVSLALVSAIVSSADSALVTAATVLSHDLLGSRSVTVSRICVLGIGACGLGVSLMGKSILGYLLMAYDVYACGVVAPVFAAMLLGAEKGVDGRFACAAVVLGGCLGFAAAVTGEAAFSYTGLALSGLVTCAGALRMRRAYPAAG